MWIFIHDSNGSVSAQHYPASQQRQEPMDTTNSTNADTRIQNAAQQGLKRPAEHQPAENPSLKRPRPS